MRGKSVSYEISDSFINNMISEIIVYQKLFQPIYFLRKLVHIGANSICSMQKCVYNTRLVTHWA